MLTTTNSSVSGRVAGIAIDPTNGNIYIAAAGGGVWESTNNGTSWNPLTDNQVTLSMGAIAIAPSNHLKIYAGTGEGNNAFDANYGQGILHSEDGGVTWNLTQGSFYRQAIARISVDPGNANIAYAAVALPIVNPTSTPNTGIYKTTDGGVTWTNVTALAGADSKSAWSDVAVDPNNSSIVYAAHGTFAGSTYDGVYRSADAGKTWSLLSSLPSGSNAGRIGLAFAPSANTAGSHVLYVAMGGVSQTVYLSNNADAAVPTFSSASRGPLFGLDITLIADPNNAASVYVANSDSYFTIYHSTNSGSSWSAAMNFPGSTTQWREAHAMAWTSAGQLLIGHDAGVFVYNPTTSVLASINANLNIVQFQSVALHPTNTAIAIGGTNFDGVALYAGSSSWAQVVSGTAAGTAISQSDGSTFYEAQSTAGGPSTNYLSVSKDGGNTWGSIGQPNSIYGFPPFWVDPSNGNRILWGSTLLFESLNAGLTWTTLVNPASSLKSIAANPGSGTIYVSDAKSIWLSSNDGSSWTDISLPVSGTIAELDAGPNDATGATAYAVSSSFNGANGQVFQTTNFGSTWTNISGNLPQIPVWSLKVDRDTSHTIYVATDSGVYSSPFPYSTWTAYGTGLPNAQDTQLQFNSKLHLLAVATHGRGVWETLTPPGMATGPTVNIDTPSAGSAVSGSSVTVSGWAVENSNLNSVIKSVAIAVDGKFAGNATYGTSRPDVCAVYPSSPSCPNVGFTYSLSPSIVGGGNHVITVTATDSGSPSLSSFSSTTVNIPYPPPVVNIDTPSASATTTLSGGYLTVSGWALEGISYAGAAMASVTLSLDGGTPVAATYGSSRPDVCAAFPNRPNCPNVGFTASLYANGTSAGAHTLTAVATDVNQKNATSQITFNLAGPQVNIDGFTPGSSGYVNLQGWILISRFAYAPVYSIDGAFGGYLNYGLSRPDVCAVYPGNTNCPNVGFSGPISIANLPAGPHKITVSATDINGVTTTATATYMAVGPPSINIDAPAAGATVSGTISLAGWALESTSGVGSALSYLSIAVDGVYLINGNALYGIARPDVCGVFPGRPGCPNVGFTASLNSTLYTNGSHTLTVTAYDVNGVYSSATTKINIANASPTVAIDQPAANSTLSGNVNISGWALESATNIGSAVANVQIYIDQTYLGNANYGLSRTDVCNVYPNRSGCPSVGYSFALSTAQFSNGSHTLTVTAADQYGLAGSTSVPVTFSNILPTINVDSPAANATVSGAIVVSGWALDSTAALGNQIQHVSVSLDGGPGSTATYGLSRPDVCQVYPGRAGCPNVGFSYTLNRGAAISPGTHKIVVTAFDSAGALSFVTVTFQVAPSSSASSNN